MSRREPTGRKGASAPGALPSPAAVARETRSRRRKELTHLGGPHASLVRTQWAAGVSGPVGRGCRRWRPPPAPDLRRSESATTAAGTAPLRRRDQAPRADRASRPGRSRGFTRSIVPEPRSGGGAGGVGSHAGGRRARAPGLRAGEAGGSEVRWVLRTPAGGRAGVGAARLWRERRPHLPRLSPRAAGGERPRRACGAPVLSFSPQSRFGPVAPAGGRRGRAAG